MGGAAGAGGGYQKTSHNLESDFTLEKGQEDVVCVDLEGEWSESSKIFRHPDFKNKNVEYVSGEVGEGGDHMNLTFKNIGNEVITITGEEIVVLISEDPNEIDPNLVTKLEDQKLSEPQQDTEQLQKEQQEKENEVREKEREEKEKKEKEQREKEDREREEKRVKEQREKEQKEEEQREKE